MKEIRWGIIGCGNVTEIKSGPGMQLANHSQLIAVMRRDSILAADYAQRHGIAKWYDQADALIADPDVDVIYIATPPAFHMEYTLAAARAGKPVYVEKPMAMNVHECQTMINACEEANVPLYVAYYRRALPRFLKVKELLAAGAIGDVRFVTTMHRKQPSHLEVEGTSKSWRTQPELSGGGHFFDLGSHTLDLLDFLLGPIVKASGVSSNQAGMYEVEDIVTGLYTFESGVQGTGVWCFSANDNVEWNEIVGSRGKLTFSTFADVPIQLVNEHEERSWTIPNPKHIQQPLIQSIVDDLLKIGVCPSTGVTAARTNHIMESLTKK